MKNYKKYGPTGILWALYLIVGVVAFFVSNLYFKFEFKDAIIFGVVNLLAVVAITEGIDWIFKKARLRQERKAAEEVTSDETVEKTPSDESATTVEEPTNDTTEKEDGSSKADEELGFKETLHGHLDGTLIVGAIHGTEGTAGVDDEAPLLITGAQGSGKNFHLLAHAVSLKNAESADSEAKETIVEADAKETTADVTPILITGAPGLGHSGYWSGANLVALENADSVDSAAKEATVESSAPVDSLPNVADTAVEQAEEVSAKPRGRRANPEAVIDAPTSSMPIITPDMIKPKVEATVATEPVVEKPSLSANDFLDATKLTSPRAIVREYQRLGGKEDIYSILAERKK